MELSRNGCKATARQASSGKTVVFSRSVRLVHLIVKKTYSSGFSVSHFKILFLIS